MAEVIYQDPVQEIRGTLTKDGTIHRRKYYRDANGKIIGASKPEAYQILYPASVQSRVCRDQAYPHGSQIPQSASHPIDQPCASVGLHAHTRRPCYAPVLAIPLQSPTPKARTRSTHRSRHRPPQDLLPLRCLHPHLPFARDAMTYAYFCRNHIQSAEKFAYLKKK